MFVRGGCKKEIPASRYYTADLSYPIKLAKIKLLVSYLENPLSCVQAFFSIGLFTSPALLIYLFLSRLFRPGNE